MSNQDSWEEKRAHPRIQWQFITKFKHKDSDEIQWELPAIKDISEGGCYFFSSAKCEVGQRLDIEIQFPRLKEPMHFVGEVRRVDDQSGELQRYGIAVQFVELDESKKAIFIETIKFFVEKKGQM